MFAPLCPLTLYSVDRRTFLNVLYKMVSYHFELLRLKLLYLKLGIQRDNGYLVGPNDVFACELH